MKLSEFSGPERIFIDTNIFVYHFLNDAVHGTQCTEFLEKIELGLINAVTSILVIEEAVFAIMIAKGSEVLRSKSTKAIREKLKSNLEISKACLDEVLFWIILNFSAATGLKS